MPSRVGSALRIEHLRAGVRRRERRPVTRAPRRWVIAPGRAVRDPGPVNQVTSPRFKMMASNPKNRLTVEFPPRIDSVLESLSAEQSTTKTEILKRAIATYKLLQDEVQKGANVYLIEPDGSRTRVILP